MKATVYLFILLAGTSLLSGRSDLFLAPEDLPSLPVQETAQQISLDESALVEFLSGIQAVVVHPIPARGLFLRHGEVFRAGDHILISGLDSPVVFSGLADRVLHLEEWDQANRRLTGRYFKISLEPVLSLRGVRGGVP